jgi:hypothetical protein
MEYTVDGWNRVLLMEQLPLAPGPISTVATARALRGQACQAISWRCSYKNPGLCCTLKLQNHKKHVRGIARLFSDTRRTPDCGRMIWSAAKA